MASLSLQHIYKIYAGGVTAVSDFTLDIEDKEFIVLVGPSGCGKSTTLRMVAGLGEISDGELYIGDKLVNDVAPKDRDIAMVFQNYALYPHMTIYDNMAFGLKLRKTPKAEIDRRVKEAAKILDIEHLLTRKPKALSGGQRQRVALGRAIVREPKVFLMDEPLSNLDAKLRVQMRTVIKKLQKRLGITTVYVTHDQEEAPAISDRIAVMKEGNIMQVGTSEQIYKKPENAFVAGFIGTSNFMDCIVSGNDPDHASLEIKGEHSLPARLRTPYSGNAILSARPEQLFFDQEQGLSGTVSFSTFLGDFIEYEILLDNGQTIQLNEYTKDVHTVRPDGEKVHINFNMNAVSLYRTDTQEVISK